MKATAMHEVYKTKNGWGVDKSKTIVSLRTDAPVSLPQFCLRGEGDRTQSKQLSVKVLYIVMLVNPQTNLHNFPQGFKPDLYFWNVFSSVDVHAFCFLTFSASL